MAHTTARKAPRPPPNLLKRSFALSGHRTSVALEPEFWTVLEAHAGRAGRTLSAVVAEVDAGRSPSRPLASALRVHALQILSEAKRDVVSQVSQ